MSGFRIDLGVVDPDAAGSYLAGVECDGATYHRGATARDRDRLRQHVLETLGWRILRIWSTDWWTNASREGDRLHEQLGDVLKRGRALRAELQGPASMSEALAEETGLTAGGELATVLPDSVSLSETSPAPEKFYDPAYRDTLAVLVLKLLREEGPLRENRLVQAIARLHGFSRAGREIRDRVMAVVPATSTLTNEGIGRFVWPPGVNPYSWDTFREPAAGEAVDPAEIPLPELIVLARKCMTPGITEETVLIAMRDACGLQRLRETARSRCVEALAAVRN